MKRFISTTLLLLAILLPATANSSSVLQSIYSSQGLKDLTGDISIHVLYTPSNYPNAWSNPLRADIIYSGDEDVTITANLNGESIATSHDCEMELYNISGNDLIQNVLKITVHADGYKDLVDSTKYYSGYRFKDLRYYADCIPQQTNDSIFSYEYELYGYYSIYTSGSSYRGFAWSTSFRTYCGNITIPSSVTVIEDNAFNVLEGTYYFGPDTYPDESVPVTFPTMQSNVAILKVPASIKKIMPNAFGYNPYSFYSVNIEDLEAWCAINFRGYNSNPLMHSNYLCLNDERVINLIIPNTIPFIRSYAFAGCPNFESVTLPISTICGNMVFTKGSVSSLILTGEGGFQGGSLDMTAANVHIDAGITEIEGILVKPTDVYCYSYTPPTCDENTFTDYSGTLHVPAAALAAYFTAPYWSNFINIVGDAVEPKSVTINQDTISLRPSKTQELMATVTPTNACGTIVWNSTDNNVASVENGQVTAIAPGECDIIANCVGKQASCHVIVTEVKPTSITLNQDYALMETGSQLTLSATVLPDSTTYKTVEWSSSDVTVATVDNGIVTAVHAGECDIIAQCQNIQAICHVTVTGILPTAITISNESAIMKLYSELTLSATVLPDNATYNTVTWSSSNETIAKVDNGVVTTVGTGECDIIAQCRDLQAVCHLTVVQFTLDQHEANLLPNHILTLVPDISPIFGNIQVSSSDPTVAAARLVNGIVQVVGIKEGTAAIILNSADGYAFSDSCLVEVYTERGDVNCDGFVNISDGTVLIDILLGGDVNHSEENADCNSDGKITISDLTALIDALLGGAPLPEKNYEMINVNGVSFKMIKVQGGTFTMGATPEQGTEEPWNDEWPTHEVTVSSFSIGQTEVTQELWQAVMGSNPSYFTGDPKRPIETVSWDECQQFIATLNQLTGMNFRMPTEAEWEYAARGGNRSEGYKYSGSNDINETTWWDDNAGDGVGESSPEYGTHPVAFKKANELGLYDMSGNVWEWCQDWYGPYSQEAQINPTGPETGTEHLYRGGSWINYARNCRVSCRFHWVTNGVNYVGLRLVK